MSTSPGFPAPSWGDPAVLAAELCRAGIWERAEDGYRILDAEAVQVCVDRVRELREEEAWLARLPDHTPSVPPAGAAGTTRLGDRVPDRPAVSFRCGQCGEVAGILRVARAGSSTSGRGPSSGGQPGSGDGLVLNYFIGPVWHAGTGDVVDAVQALIEQGSPDPVTIREISWALWDITPFYCPECQLNYCSPGWDAHLEVREETYDCIIGTCPRGHQHLLG